MFLRNTVSANKRPSSNSFIESPSTSFCSCNGGTKSFTFFFLNQTI